MDGWPTCLVTVRVQLHWYLDSCRAVLPTLSDGSINRGLVCASHIPVMHGLKRSRNLCPRRVSAGYKHTRTKQTQSPKTECDYLKWWEIENGRIRTYSLVRGEHRRRRYCQSWLALLCVYSEQSDLSRGRRVLVDLIERNRIPVFLDMASALHCTVLNIKQVLN